MTPCLKCLHLLTQTTPHGKFCRCELNAPGWIDDDCTEWITKDPYGQLIRRKTTNEPN